MSYQYPNNVNSVFYFAGAGKYNLFSGRNMDERQLAGAWHEQNGGEIDNKGIICRTFAHSEMIFTICEFHNTKIWVCACGLLYSRYDLELVFIFKMLDYSSSYSRNSLMWFYRVRLCCWPSCQDFRTAVLNRQICSFFFCMKTASAALYDLV